MEIFVLSLLAKDFSLYMYSDLTSEIVALADALKVNTTLEVLDLGYTNLSRGCIEAVVGLLTHNREVAIHLNAKYEYLFSSYSFPKERVKFFPL